MFIQDMDTENIYSETNEYKITLMNGPEDDISQMIRSDPTLPATGAMKTIHSTNKPVIKDEA